MYVCIEKLGRTGENDVSSQSHKNALNNGSYIKVHDAMHV